MFRWTITVILDEMGFANIALGLKYVLISDPAEESILSAAVKYEGATKRSFGHHDRYPTGRQGP